MMDECSSRFYLPRLESQGEEYKHFQFGAGESHFQILTQTARHVEIMFRYTGDQSIIQLLLLNDALKRQGAELIDLYIPYFPGARQDRVCNQGEALSVKIYADLINLQNFNRVTIFDPHSDVTAALLNKVHVVKNHQLIKEVMVEIGKEIILISPDAGSNKKIFDLSVQLGGLEVIRADKVRDVSNGQIIDTEVYCDDLGGKTCVIIDDICAGGRTFMELAKKLKAKNCGKIVLIVSHYEGVAKEADLRASGIEAIFSTNSLKDIASSDFLKIKDIWSFMPFMSNQGVSK
ncbi:ribose-phosphate diphosphokinase [Janthinobacterium sp. B9-8]|uniref:ribose-phosphate diphosphokinase n=1 Tax=Janthinobacterium sp. B9-8 TaxID=1236179 RepID=UPI00061D3B77|nr:ribose-phosphate diphosphokinase [Janthinobacterium sp. B9-8]